MTVPVVEILTDGGAKHGHGHLRRSLALAESLATRGRCVPRVLGMSDEAQAVIGRLAHATPPARAPEAAVVVFDAPAVSDEAVQSAGRGERAVVALDYFGAAAPDLTISVRERGQRPPGRRVAGIEYAIIRREIRALRGRTGAGNGTGVIVVMGGADVRERGPVLAAQLAARGERVTLICGPGSRAAPRLAAGVTQVHDPPNFAALLHECRWAVSNGGVTMTELLCLAKPVYVVPQTPEERALALDLHERGALIGVGETPPAGPHPRASGELGAELCDGQGADRICALVEEFLE